MRGRTSLSRLPRRALFICVLIMCVAGVPIGGTVAQADPGFHILVGGGGEKLVDLLLPAADGWVFGDRIAYSCAYFYLNQDGTNVARVTIERAGGYDAQINDKYGDEQHPQTACGTDPTPLTFSPTPEPFTINTTAFTLGGLLSDATWATGGCLAGAPYDYLIYDGAPIVKVTVESLGAAVGPCPSPTIGSISPTSGAFGTSVVLSGTDLTGVTGVAFDGVIAQQFSVDSATQLTVVLPDGATTGPVSVTTPDGTVSGSGRFTVIHQATLRLRLLRSAGGLLASGSIRIPDGTKGCWAGRRVIIENKVNDSWHMQGTAVTRSDGSFRYGVDAIRGWVRGRLKQSRLDGGDICEPAQDSAHAH
ncbi:MAG: IPT/TIG domain-containing protein [Actinomycetota bacterium]